MKKILAMVLCMALLVSAAMFVSCGDNKNKSDDVTLPIGEYVMEINATDMLVTPLAQLEEQSGAPLEIDDFYLAFLFDVRADGMTLSLDKERMSNEYDEYTEDMKKYMKEYLFALGERNGMSEEAVIAKVEENTGMPFDEGVDSMVVEIVEQAFNENFAPLMSMETTMDYTVEGNKLLADDGSCMNFTVDGNTLILESDDIETSALEAYGMGFPWVLVKK